MGNLLTPLRTSGELASHAKLRAVIRNSSAVGRFEPKQSTAWRKGAGTFGKFRSRVLV